VRVGVDARTLAAEQRSGVEQYVVGLVRALSRLDDAPEIIAYVDRTIPDPELDAATSSGLLRTHVVRARRGWLRAALPWRLWRDHVDLVHLPSTILPPILPCPAVATVHDLAWIRYPRTYSREDLAMQRLAVSGAARRARHIIANSENTARDLRENYPACSHRITAIPLGVSADFSPAGPRLSNDILPAGTRPADGYILYVGRLHPRKNLRLLLRAYRLVLDQVAAPPLLIVGPITAYGEELVAEARRLEMEQHVVFPGYLPETLLPALYRSATVFVYPSLYEGVGLPVLEAMASGVPVVTSNTSAMPEVAGEAALLVGPEDVQGLTSAIVRLLTDQDLRKSLSERGRARSREFTWERTARATVEVYRRAVGQ